MTAPAVSPLGRIFDDIEAALSKAENGRLFLAEHARRQRAADTEAVLAALARLRQEMVDDIAALQMDHVRREITGMSDAIAQTRKDISALGPHDGANQIALATEELSAIVTATEQATGEILGAAERIQAAVANARKCDPAALDVIENAATEIFTACSFQDITGQRTAKVVGVLLYLEERMKVLMGLWPEEAPSGASQDMKRLSDTRPDAHLMTGPSRDGTGVKQDEVDRMMAEAAPPAATISQDDIDNLFN